MPLFWLSLAFTAGLFLSSFLNLPNQLYTSLFILFSLCTLAEYKFSDPQSHPLLSRPLVKLPFSLIAAAFVLGGCRFEAAIPVFDETDLAWYSNSKDVIVTGQVISYPENDTDSTSAIIRAHSILLPGQHEKDVNGKLELRLPAGFHLSYGDLLTMEGKLGKVAKAEEQPFLSYQARKGIYNRMAYPQIETIAQNKGSPIMAAIYHIRQKALEVIYKQIPYPESSLLSGILLGIDWVIPDYLKEAYQSCGVIHIIAISGYNIALVSNVITRLTQRFLSPTKAGFTALAAITLYTLMVGADPAVVRAAVMGGLSVPAALIGRRTIPIHNLAVAAALMLLGNPFLLWDISFQLSFLACLGLITMVDPLLERIQSIFIKFEKESAYQWWQPILTLILTTICAQFAVSPVIFNISPQISLSSLPANLVLLPIQPILMALGALSVVFGLLIPTLGQIFAFAAWPFLAYCNRIALNFGFHVHAETTAPAYFFWIFLIADVLTLSIFTALHIRKIAHPKPQDAI
jgi:competence protein ComEC